MINQVKPFVDAYGGPFKVKWCFWFGVRLWLTIVLFCVDGALEGTNKEQMLLFHIIAVMLFILLQVFVQPFKNVFVGLIDAFFMINYWIIIEVYSSFNSIFYVVYVVLTLAAILVLCAIVLYQGCPLKFKKHLVLFRHQHRGYEGINATGERKEEEDSDGDLYRAAEEREIDTY